MSKKPCKYAFKVGDRWECDGYLETDCPYQSVEYHVDSNGHKEINIVNCIKEQTNE